MAEKKICELYVRLAFQYESAIDALLTKGLIDTDLATATKGKFYDSLNEEKLRTSKKIRDYHEARCRNEVFMYRRTVTVKGHSPAFSGCF